MSMETKHRKTLKLGNHMRNMVGQPFYGKKPPQKEVLEALLNSMAEYTGTCWAPVAESKDGKSTAWDLMIHQCPGACGQVLKLTLRDDQIARWLVNEVNQRRWGENGLHRKK